MGKELKANKHEFRVRHGLVEKYRTGWSYNCTARHPTAAHLVCILRRSIRFTLPSSLSRAPNRRFSGSFLSLRRTRKACRHTYTWHRLELRAYGTGMVESTTWPLLGPGTKEKGAREPKHDNGPANNYHYITSTEGESTVATGFVNNPSPSLVFWGRRASRGRKRQVGRHYRHHHHHHLRRLQSSKWYKHENNMSAGQHTQQINTQLTNLRCPSACPRRPSSRRSTPVAASSAAPASCRHSRLLARNSVQGSMSHENGETVKHVA